MVGTALALGLTAALTAGFVELTALTGLASEDALNASFQVGGISLRGLLLAGIIIGGLGVLDDVTVSQASLVFELRRANPAAGFAELTRGALAVGRDHVSASVNTLFLAYAGASLPLLVLFVSGGEAAGDGGHGRGRGRRGRPDPVRVGRPGRGRAPDHAAGRQPGARGAGGGPGGAGARRDGRVALLAGQGPGRRVGGRAVRPGPRPARSRAVGGGRRGRARRLGGRRGTAGGRPPGRRAAAAAGRRGPPGGDRPRGTGARGRRARSASTRPTRASSSCSGASGPSRPTPGSGSRATRSRWWRRPTASTACPVPPTGWTPASWTACGPTLARERPGRGDPDPAAVPGPPPLTAPGR